MAVVTQPGRAHFSPLSRHENRLASVHYHSPEPETSPSIGATLQPRVPSAS